MKSDPGAVSVAGSWSPDEDASLASRPDHLSSGDPSACVTHALGSYLVSLTTPPRGTNCLSDRLPFDPGFGQPAVARGGAALAH
jgi:hypothetical protein